nr:hypothetical protein [Mycobacterium sp. 1465703.0]
MTTRGDRGQRQWRIRFRFDDFDRGPNRAGRNEPFASDEGFAMGMVDGQQESAHQALNEGQSDQRLIHHAIRAEKLLAEHADHVDPASGRARGAGQDRREVGVSRDSATECAAESIVYRRALDLQAIDPASRRPSPSTEALR